MRKIKALIIFFSLEQSIIRCAIGELKSVLGASYSESLEAARSLLTARCGHEKRRLLPEMNVTHRAPRNEQEELILSDVTQEVYEAKRAEHYFSENKRVFKGLEDWLLETLRNSGSWLQNPV
nr:rRNA-processing protein UTP23 homolog [Ipomoea batatas]